MCAACYLVNSVGINDSSDKKLLNCHCFWLVTRCFSLFLKHILCSSYVLMEFLILFFAYLMNEVKKRYSCKSIRISTMQMKKKKNKKKIFNIKTWFLILWFWKIIFFVFCVSAKFDIWTIVGENLKFTWFIKNDLAC
jgi:hypothetical protein